MIAILAMLLVAEAQPEHQRQPVPVPETSRPAASEHGATLGRQEVAPGAHKPEHEQGAAEHQGGIAEHIFEHVEDEVVVPSASGQATGTSASTSPSTSSTCGWRPASS